MEWIKYDKQNPEIGQRILVYRDIESEQIYCTIWSKEEEKFAKMNDITHWLLLPNPPKQ